MGSSSSKPRSQTMLDQLMQHKNNCERNYYFAYGSDILSSRLHSFIKSACFLSVGRLNGFKLKFIGHSELWCGATVTISKEEKETVIGVVWVINDTADWNRLNRRKYNCSPIDVTIQIDDQSMLQCRTYIKRKQVGLRRRPSRFYKHVLTQGAIEHDFPIDYINWLISIPDNGSTFCNLPELLSETARINCVDC